MFDQMEIPATVDRRIAANLLQLLSPRIQEAQALLEAVEVLRRVVAEGNTSNLPSTVPGGQHTGVRRALSPEGGE